MDKDVGVCLMKVDWMVFKRFFLPHTQTIRLYIDRPALKTPSLVYPGMIKFFTSWPESG